MFEYTQFLIAEVKYITMGYSRNFDLHMDFSISQVCNQSTCDAWLLSRKNCLAFNSYWAKINQVAVNCDKDICYAKELDLYLHEYIIWKVEQFNIKANFMIFITRYLTFYLPDTYYRHDTTTIGPLTQLLVSILKWIL